MRIFILLLGVAVVSFASATSYAENLSYMISGQEQWNAERLEKDIQKAEDKIALEQARLSEMQQERAEKLSAIESAAGDQDGDLTHDHYLGHH